MEIIFVRHTSVDVAPGTCYGQSDVPLNESFQQEAEAVRQQLLSKAEHPLRVYTSPLFRCTRLAEYCGFPDAIRDSLADGTEFRGMGNAAIRLHRRPEAWGMV